MPYTIETALYSDAEAIASAFTADELPYFRRLQNGTVDPGDRKAGAVEMWTKMIANPAYVCLVAREAESGLVVSYAQWVKPKDEDEKTVARSQEEKAKIREQRSASSKPGMNTPLLLEFYEKIDDLEQDGFRGRRRWYLNSLGTLAAHRGKGLASRLVRYPFADADRDGVAVALFTDGQGKAKGLYEKLGFIETSRFEIELESFGGEGKHVEVAMVREPTGGE
ncbi:hypothetical protein BJ170DRAFT_164656 [Xylariales sp. AK1849]|nr:hypothetical protein BJ170DRAFT_164656 [Xylariales sp. AK1849]